MKKTAWIWFVGLAAWALDALINLRPHNWLHARLALIVALLFGIDERECGSGARAAVTS